MKRDVKKEVAAVRQQVERWRQNGGGKGSRIPEKLWSEAVGLARVEGLYATSRALRFNYYSLKKRVDQAKSEERRKKSERTAFVEVEMGPLGSSGKTIVELVGRRGSRLRIDVTGASGVDVVGLAQAFWSREP
jgi:hypothetical protein